MTWLERIRHRISSSARVADLTRELEKSEQQVRRLRERLQEKQERLDAAKRRTRALKSHLTRQAQPSTGNFSRKPFARPDAGRFYALTNVVSYPKCGRTWMAHLYCHYTRYHFNARDVPHRSLNMPERNAAFQELLVARARNHVFPVCLFTHLGFSSFKPFEQNGEEWPDKARTVLLRPTVLLIRDPRDVLVSHYHHLRERRVIETDTTLSDFVRGPWGVGRVVRFMNMWAPAVHAALPNLFLCAYESLRTDTARTLTEVLEFLGVTPQPAGVSHAMKESSFERLRQKEHSRRRHQGVSLAADAFRFRQGTIGSHAMELSEADTAYLDEFLVSQLDSAFDGYHHRPAPATVAANR